MITTTTKKKKKQRTVLEVVEVAVQEIQQNSSVTINGAYVTDVIELYNSPIPLSTAIQTITEPTIQQSSIPLEITRKLKAIANLMQSTVPIQTDDQVYRTLARMLVAVPV